MRVEAIQAERFWPRSSAHGSSSDTGWHFGKTHPLAAAAKDLCDTAGHPRVRRLSAHACGACFEQVIREDERTRTRKEAS